MRLRWVVPFVRSLFRSARPPILAAPLTAHPVSGRICIRCLPAALLKPVSWWSA